MQNQFKVDVPRIYIEINGSPLQSRCAKYIEKSIAAWCLTSNVSKEDAMYWCTQTAYAEIYELKQKSLPMHQSAWQTTTRQK